MKADEIFHKLGIARADQGHAVHSPVDGALIGHVAFDDAAAIDRKIATVQDAFREWRSVPAPRRG